jgi:hypothetical protein
MEVLSSMARDANMVFTETHGGASRCRDKSNPNRWGDGHSSPLCWPTVFFRCWRVLANLARSGRVCD